MPKILIVEDNIPLAQTLEDLLETGGHTCTIANSFEQALECDFQDAFDLYLLDINLPGESGIELLKTLRQSDITTPAIFLTSHKEKQMLQKGFQSGADDFITKPFDNEELLLRINAVCKRSGKLDTQMIQLSNSIYFDPHNLSIIQNNTIHKIPQKLSQLLQLLFEYRSQIVTKEMIIERLWSDENFSDGSLRVYITKLKSILGKDAINNIKGIGYQLELP